MLSKSLKPLTEFRIQSFLLLILLVILVKAYLVRLQDGETFSDLFWRFIDPVAGIMTFATTLGIFYFQGYQSWEESLEKRLTVSYFGPVKDQVVEIVRIERAYLAGESDVRARAQSLGCQILGQLDFDLDWDEEPTKAGR